MMTSQTFALLSLAECGWPWRARARRAPETILIAYGQDFEDRFVPPVELKRLAALGAADRGYEPGFDSAGVVKASGGGVGDRRRAFQTCASRLATTGRSTASREKRSPFLAPVPARVTSRAAASVVSRSPQNRAPR